MGVRPNSGFFFSAAGQIGYARFMREAPRQVYDGGPHYVNEEDSVIKRPDLLSSGAQSPRFRR